MQSQMYIKDREIYCALHHGYIHLYAYGWNKQTDDQIFTVSDKQERERDRAE